MPKRKRNYKKEYQDFHGTTKQKKRRAQRNAARAKMKKKLGAKALKGKDVDHKDRNTGNNSSSNLRVSSKKKNRGWRKGKS